MALRLLLCSWFIALLLTAVHGRAPAAEMEDLSDAEMQRTTGGAIPNPYLCCETAGCCENTCAVDEQHICRFQFPEPGSHCVLLGGYVVQDGCTEVPLEFGGGSLPQTQAWCCRQYIVYDPVGCQVPQGAWHTFNVCTSSIILWENFMWWPSTCSVSACKYLVRAPAQGGELTALASALTGSGA